MTKFELFKAGVAVAASCIIGATIAPFLTFVLSFVFLWNLYVAYIVAAIITFIIVIFVARYLIDRANFKEDAEDN